MSAPRPVVGICVIVRRGDQLLLGRRKNVHGDGAYVAPGGHLEHLESFEQCAAREVLEEAGVEIGPIRFLLVRNNITFAPKHYVEMAFVADWKSGEPELREPDKIESWGWYSIDALPTPLFALLPDAAEALRAESRASTLPKDIRVAEIIGACLQQLSAETRRTLLYKGAVLEAIGWYAARDAGDDANCARLAEDATTYARPLTFVTTEGQSLARDTVAFVMPDEDPQ